MRPQPAAGCPFDVVVVAASLGGVPALSRLVADLPADFPAPVVVIQQRSPTPDLLRAVLGRVSHMPVAEGAPGRPQDSVVHVIPPRGGQVFDSAGELCEAVESRRPADEVMVSDARAFGQRVCAVVLTGRGDDGARGIRAVKGAGGMTLAQAAHDARAPQMPTAAAATGCLDRVLPLRVLGPALVSLAMAPGVAQMFSLPPRPWANLAVG